MSIYEKQLAQILKDAGYAFVQEYQFAPPRKWRFDFALDPVKCKIAIEVNGGHFMRGGRHTFGKGYENDLEKLNRAMIDGWIVLQYVPATLPNILTDLKKLTEK